MKKIELYYGLICPFCKTAKKILKKIIKENPGKFSLKQTLVSSPGGMVKSYKYGIHSVPTILIDDKIVFRALPEEEELKKELNLI